MNKIFLSMISICFFVTSTFAAILQTTPSSHHIEKIQIAKEGTVSIEEQKIPVSLLGAGLREKKVMVFPVNVYVAELFANEPGKFIRTSTEALNSLEQSQTIALRLHFLRTVDAATLEKSFKAALLANNLNPSEEPLAGFLAAISSGGEATKGQSLTIVSQKNIDKTERIFYENTSGKMATPLLGPEGFSKKIMSIWLGVPVDKEVEILKEILIKGP